MNLKINHRHIHTSEFNATETYQIHKVKFCVSCQINRQPNLKTNFLSAKIQTQKIEFLPHLPYRKSLLDPTPNLRENLKRASMKFKVSLHFQG